jgi:hypothetical protein
LLPPAASDSTYKKVFYGGGQVRSGDTVVRHKCNLYCDKAASPQSLEISYGDNNKFILSSLSAAACSSSPLAASLNPCLGLGLPSDVAAVQYPFNTYAATGTGSINGVAGAQITLEFTDGGDIGSSDHFSCKITDKTGAVVLNTSGFLRYGNHQALLYK